MISKEERMYFIDPLQPAEVRTTNVVGNALAFQIIPLRYRREGTKAETMGTVVNVSHQRVENNELWWVDADGDFVYGAQLVDRITGRGSVMTIINDDLFYVGRNGGEITLPSGEYGTQIVDARRSDGKVLPGLPNMAYTYAARRVVKAAPWAHDLMPVPGDTEEIVTAKVARAKQKFIHRHKKGEIYKEGMRRDWLHHLERLRADHDMPTPVFNIGVTGTFLSSATDAVEMDSLTPAQRQRLEPIDRNAVIRHDSRNRTTNTAQTFVGKPFTAVTGMTAHNLAEVMEARATDVKYAVFESLRTHSGHVLEATRFPILTSF